MACSEGRRGITVFPCSVLGRLNPTWDSEEDRGQTDSEKKEKKKKKKEENKPAERQTDNLTISQILIPLPACPREDRQSCW